MNNQAQLDYPELTRQYLEGVRARTEGRSKSVCPYLVTQLFSRSLWLAGWNDTDIWMTADPVAA